MGLILSTFLLPVKIFRAVMTFFSLIWAILLIAIIVLIVVYWNDIKNIFDNLVEGITNIKTTVESLTSKINDLETKVDEIKAATT